VKTAISLPDKLFKQAERLARRLKVSRSELYARAIAHYMRTHSRKEITRHINAFVDKHPDLNALDPVLQSLQARSLSKKRQRAA
jgi:GTP1/Obg family GTP-binding protein